MRIEDTKEEWNNVANNRNVGEIHLDMLSNTKEIVSVRNYSISDMNIIDLEILRQKLKAIRKGSKLSQKVVAEGINTTHNLISRIETGGNDFKVGTLIKLLNVYGYEIKLLKK